MKLVIDANVGISALLPEKNSAIALELRRGFRRGIHELFAPDLYFLEVGNVLINSARAGRFPTTDRPFLYSELFRHQPIICHSTALFPRAFSIASSIRVSVYDALYLALSELENCPLVSDDVRLQNAAQGFDVISLASVSTT